MGKNSEEKHNEAADDGATCFFWGGSQRAVLWVEFLTKLLDPKLCPKVFFKTLARNINLETGMSMPKDPCRYGMFTYMNGGFFGVLLGFANSMLNKKHSPFNGSREWWWWVSHGIPKS